MDQMLWHDKTYNLAKNTLSLARKIEAAEQAVSMTDAYRKQMEIVTDALGYETVHDILGTTDIEEVDLTELVLVYNAVITGYEKRISDMRMSQDEKLFSSPAYRGIGKVADDIRVIQAIDNKML